MIDEKKINNFNRVLTAQDLLAFFDGHGAHQLDAARFEMRYGAEITGVLGAHFQHSDTFAFRFLIFTKMLQHKLHPFLVGRVMKRSSRP